MSFLILLPTILTFLFTLYKLVKDDHVFIRKNVKLEQFFDIAFIVILSSWIFITFFLPENITSITYIVTGGSLVLCLLGKYKNLPIGRLFDFFTISFLTSIPPWFLLSGLIINIEDRLLFFSFAFAYLILALVFTKGFFPGVMSRKIREGTLSLCFFIIFTIISLVIPIFNAIKNKSNFLVQENIVLIVFMIFSIILLIRPKNNRYKYT